MHVISKLTALACLIALSSCTKLETYPYSIKDFDKQVQPFLRSIVQDGILYHENSGDESFEKKMTIKELKKLSKSEHPILRALALRVLVKRTDWDPTEWIKDCLSDTAVVVTDNGEFGINYEWVADIMLWNTSYPSTQKRAEMMDFVIKNHNNLRHAYPILTWVELKPEYYPIIKRMANRGPKSYEEANSKNGNNYPFSIIEDALYGLARFQKKEDIPFIKSIILDDIYTAQTSWGLMEDFPDTSYLEVFRKYVERQIIDDVDNRSGGHIYDFANCCGSYHSKESAEILLSGYKKIINEYLPRARGDVYNRAKTISGSFKAHGTEDTRSLIKDFAKWPEYYNGYEVDRIYEYLREFSICDTAQHHGSFYKNLGREPSAPFHWLRP